MAKKKVVSINGGNIKPDELMNIVKSNYSDDVVEIEWHGIKISVNKHMTMVDMLNAVNDIVVSCFTEEGNYYPEVANFAEAVSIISRCTNIELPEDTYEKYDLLIKTDLYDTISNYIDKNQISVIRNSAEKKLKHKCNEYANYAINKINELSVQINSIAESVKEIFAGITKEDIEKIVNSIGENGINTDKIVESYIKNYGNKDENVVGM